MIGAGELSGEPQPRRTRNQAATKDPNKLRTQHAPSASARVWWEAPQFPSGPNYGPATNGTKRRRRLRLRTMPECETAVQAVCQLTDGLHSLSPLASFIVSLHLSSSCLTSPSHCRISTHDHGTVSRFAPTTCCAAGRISQLWWRGSYSPYLSFSPNRQLEWNSPTVQLGSQHARRQKQSIGF